LICSHNEADDDHIRDECHKRNICKLIVRESRTTREIRNRESEGERERKRGTQIGSVNVVARRAEEFHFVFANYLPLPSLLSNEWRLARADTHTHTHREREQRPTQRQTSSRYPGR
jgi:hypothetical protein